MTKKDRPEPTVVVDESAFDAFADEEPVKSLLRRVAASDGDVGSLLGDSGVPTIAFDAQRRILHANAAAERMFGYARGDLDGVSTDVLIPERLRQPDAPPMIETHDLVRVDLPGLMRDGSERPMEWCFGAARTGGRLLFILTVQDRLAVLHERSRLRESEQRFQLFVAGVRDYAIYMLDAEGRVSSWNAGARRVKGWAATEVIGQSYEVFFTPEDREAGLPARLLAEATQQGSKKTKGWRVRRDGSRYWVEGSLTALRDERGNVRGFAKITRDLTERIRAEENERRLIAEQAARRAAQQAERQIRASEERLARLQRVTAALSKAVTPEDVTEVVLRQASGTLAAAASGLFVLAPQADTLEMAGERGHPEGVAEAFRSVPLSREAPITHAARFQKAVFLESLEAGVSTYPSLREALGAGRFEACVALPLISHGTLLGVLVLRFNEKRGFDAHERTLLLTLGDLCAQALDRALLFAAERDARAAAESASRAKDEFLAMLGHELRNPLAPISTALELMKLRPQDDGQRERAVIARQVSHLQRLVDDLLDVSRVTRGLLSLSRKSTPVADILTKAIEIAAPLIEQRQHQLIVNWPAAEDRVNVDALRMAQVVSNLLSNAAKYTPPGGHIWLGAATEGDEVVIRVRDDGEGISPELLPHVFDLFTQGTRTLERSQGGLGLGLSIVKSLVTLHGGTVTTSSDGRGSEFVVRIPVVEADARESDAHAGEPRAPSGKPGKRILLVDDNDDARELLAEMLRGYGHQVEMAHDGPTALGKLETFSADVAILDLGLPVMDGFELARRISETRTTRTTRPRLIALTGYGRASDVAEGRSAGFEVHLVKPVDIPVLVSAIEGGAS